MLGRDTRLLFALLATGCASLLGADELSFDGKGDCSSGMNCDGGAAGSAPECVSHRDCTPESWDAPRVCVDGACVALENESGCSLIMGAENLQRDAPPFVFGVLAGLPLDSYPSTQSQALAVSEFGSMGLQVGGESRLPVGVACNVVRANPSDLDASIDHLVDTLRVPLIVASLDGLTLKRSFERVHQTKGKDVFFLSAFESDPLLTTLDDDGLLWHMLPSALDIAPLFMPLVNRVEAHVRRSLPEPETSRAIRVALLESTLPLDAEIAAYIDRNISFNGLPARDNAPADYLRLKVDSDLINDATTTAEQFALVRAFEPDVIIVSGGNELLGSIIAPLERSRAGAQRAPFYVVSSNGLGAGALSQLLTEIPDVARRLAGVNFAGAEDSTLYEEYLSAFRGSYPLADGRGTENFYDAMYFALYAAAAAGRVPELSGRHVARGMTRLIDGLRADVGATHIPNVLAYLQSTNSTLALYGTMGPPSFDAGSGARRGVGSVWCVTMVAGEPRVEFDVLRYDEASATLRGDFTCFEDF